MSYHDEPADPAVTRSLVKRTRAALAEGVGVMPCAQRFATPDGPALYVARRTEAEAAAAVVGLGAAAVLDGDVSSLPLFGAGMVPVSTRYRIEVPT